MEFWGVEVKPGKPLKVECEEDTLIHISQASLGDCKGKKGETVPLYVKVGDQKLVMGTLQSENIPQLSCDLVFDKEFELSHNWGKGSVYFVGYTSPNIEDHEGGEFFSDSEEEEEEEVGAEVPASITANGNAAKAKPAEVKKNTKPETADDDDDDDEDEDDSDSEDGMDVDEDDSDDDEDSEDEEETPTPKKPESNKKRANEAAPKSPASAKKAKAAVTPQKTEEKKKGGHTATPHPAKKGGKTPATATQSPKSASQVSCGSCKKTFNSANALESHTKAKHSAAK